MNRIKQDCEKINVHIFYESCIAKSVNYLHPIAREAKNMNAMGNYIITNKGESDIKDRYTMESERKVPSKLVEDSDELDLDQEPEIVGEMDDGIEFF